MHTNPINFASLNNIPYLRDSGCSDHLNKEFDFC